MRKPLPLSIRSVTRWMLAALLGVFAIQADAQYAWDVGGMVGGANYLGEMGGKEQTRRDFVWDMKLGQTRWAIGGFARRKLNRSFYLNAGLMYMRLQGADANSTNRGRVGRNLNFRNDLFELYFRPEFTVYQDNDLGGRGKYRTDFRIFIHAGVGVFYHNPQGQLNREGDWIDLQPLNTELADYDQIGLSIPAGIGFHFTKSRRHRFGMDISWRTTFTDYLDDVSTTYKNPASLPGGPGGIADLMADQSEYAFALDPTLPGPNNYGYYDSPGDSPAVENKRGDPTHNDSYLTMTLTYSYVLRGKSNFYRQRYNWLRGSKRVGRRSRAKF